MTAGKYIFPVQTLIGDSLQVGKYLKRNRDVWNLLGAYLCQCIYQNIQKQWFPGPNIQPVKIVIKYMRKKHKYFTLSLSQYQSQINISICKVSPGQRI